MPVSKKERPVNKIERQRLNPPLTRGGFILPVAISMIVIVLFLAATRLYVSRQNLNIAQRLSDRERAYQVSAGAIDVTVARVDSLLTFLNTPSPGTFPKRDNAPAHIRDLALNMISSDNLMHTKGCEITIQSPYLNFMKGISEAEDLFVTLSLSPAIPLYVENNPNLITDPAESRCIIIIRATATVGRSTARVTAFKRIITVNICPPVIGKFALFLREKGSLYINSIEDSDNLNNIQNTPLNVSCGSTLPERKRPVKEMVDFLDDQGWIFFGSSESWILGSGTIGNISPYMDKSLDDRIYSYDVEPDSILDKGGALSYYARKESLCRQLGTAAKEEVLELKGRIDYSNSSIINLSGAEEEKSPTIVIGNVYRKWALIQGLKNNFRNTLAPLPFLDEETFANGNWPGNSRDSTIDVIKAHFHNTFDRYRARMSNLVIEPYNKSNYSMTDFHNDRLNSTFSIDPESLLRESKEPPVLQRLRRKGEEADIGGLVEPEECTIVNSNGDVIVRNLNLQAFHDYSFMKARASYSYTTFDDYIQDQNSLKTNEHQETMRQTGVFIIESPILIQKKLLVPGGMGGILLCEGDITICNAIVAENNEPLSLISLNGNIHVQTDKDIHCALIALNGSINTGKTLKLTGLAAAKSLNLKQAPPPSKRSIIYNKAFDPSNVHNYQSKYRITTERRWNRFVH